MTAWEKRQAAQWAAPSSAFSFVWNKLNLCYILKYRGVEVKEDKHLGGRKFTAIGGPRDGEEITIEQK